MIQIGLDAAGKPELIGYAQHNSGESRKPHQMEWVERDGGRHPIVYVSPDSARVVLRVGCASVPDRDGPPGGRRARGLAACGGLRPLGQLAGPLGQLRARDRQADRQRPVEPVAPEPQVGEPGGVPAKVAPALAAGEDRPADVPRGKAVVPAAAGAVGANRGPPLCGQLRHAEPGAPAISTSPCTTVSASSPAGTVRCAGDGGEEIMRLDRAPGEPVVCGSTFNRLRQRSDVAETVPSPEGPA